MKKEIANIWEYIVCNNVNIAYFVSLWKNPIVVSVEGREVL